MIWRTGRHTPTKNSQEYLLGDQCFKLFVLRILRCNAPFPVSSARLFRKKKQPRPSVFWKARRHGGRGWVEKMGWVYLSSVNSRRIIRLWQIIRLQNPSKKKDKVRRIIRPNWTTAFFTLEMDYSSETDNPSSKSVRIDGKTDGLSQADCPCKINTVPFLNYDVLSIWRELSNG